MTKFNKLASAFVAALSFGAAAIVEAPAAKAGMLETSAHNQCANHYSDAAYTRCYERKLRANRAADAGIGGALSEMEAAIEAEGMGWLFDH